MRRRLSPEPKRSHAQPSECFGTRPLPPSTLPTRALCASVERKPLNEPTSPTVCAAELRGETNPFARAALRNRLARAVRACCFHILQVCGVPDSAAEDYTNDLAFDLVCRIERGDVTPGCEDAYVKQCGRNRARDHHRQQSGMVSRFALETELDVVPAADSDPELYLLALEEEEETQVAAGQVQTWLEDAPARYREYVVAVYLHGTPIDELVQTELLRRSEAGEVTKEDVASGAAYRRARAMVDKVLERARTWVRGRAAGGER